MLLKIGDLAKHSGLTIRTLRHYDHIGLLSPSARSEGRFRLYNQSDVVRLHRIQALKLFGCSLPDIKQFLSEQETPIINILNQQIKILQEQALHAQTLHDRLALLRDQLTRGETTGLNDWLAILGMMTKYEKHLTKQEIDSFLFKKIAGNLDEEWSRLLSAVKTAMKNGVSTESDEAHQLAWQWMRLWREFTGNDAVLAMKLRRIHREERVPLIFKEMTQEVADYLVLSFVNARVAVLANYLTPEELQIVRTRQIAHIIEWPSLIAEIQMQISSGATHEDSTVQMLAKQWDTLFRESYFDLSSTNFPL